MKYIGRHPVMFWVILTRTWQQSKSACYYDNLLRLIDDRTYATNKIPQRGVKLCIISGSATLFVWLEITWIQRTFTAK